MVNEGIPWFVWYISFRSKHNLFKKAFVTNLEALKLGQAPTAGGLLTSLQESLGRFFSSRT
jgi:hypothetical protein